MSERPQPGDGLCPHDDALVELALGQTDRQTCERMARHLAVCAGCRRSYDELAGAVELVLPGASVRRRTVLRATAAAVLGLAAGAGATAYLSRDEPGSPWARPLLTADGATVGHVSPSYGEGGQMLVVDVTAAPAGRRYTCRLRLMEGSSRDVGV